jgi:ATP-dependent RNA helicase RhlE
MSLLSAFNALDLIEPLQRAVAAENYQTMTPIQAQAIPPLLEGRDVLGCAQTGTGKTAAFLLPIMHHIACESKPGKPRIRALILTPTRELAAQIGDSFATYGQFLNLRHRVIFGGVGQRPQVTALRRGVDVLIATPGRLLDLHGQGYVDFANVGFFVLDEADRMLDMGFVRDIRRVLEVLPDNRQNLLFSATMPDSIVKLASAFLTDPVRIEVDPQSTTVERIEQQVMFVARADKKRLLADLLTTAEVESAIVFTRTKHGANRVVKDLVRGGVEAAAIHGNKTQGARTRALDGFKSGHIRVLVATDIASRGIDVDGVSHVFNFDLPNLPESYVHRIGRTGRAGREGVAIAFCDETEKEYLRDIEKLTGKPLDVILEHDWHCPEAVPEPPRKSTGRGKGRRQEQGSGRRRGQGSTRSGGASPSPGRRMVEGSARRRPETTPESKPRTGTAGATRPGEDRKPGTAGDGNKPRRRHRRRRRSGQSGSAPDSGAGQGARSNQSSQTQRQSTDSARPDSSGGDQGNRRPHRRRRNPGPPRGENTDG